MGDVNIGEKAPSFTIVDTDLKPRTLGELDKKVVLAFYPGAFTSVCTKEMCAFRDSLAKFNDLNASVIGISVNDPFTNKAFAEANKLNFPLLSDYNREVVSLYGVEAKDFAGLKGYTAAKRAVFIIGRNGVIRYKWISDDLGVEPNYREIESELELIA
ncbi:MAG: peroxiredoxin [Candidatus Bathyarchaeota archaeon]|nr:peroxiredoxin [Candidatus Bathyarchaeota archaeon]